LDEKNESPSRVEGGVGCAGSQPDAPTVLTNAKFSYAQCVTNIDLMLPMIDTSRTFGGMDNLK
jgi:hypothetical protein